MKVLLVLLSCLQLSLLAGESVNSGHAEVRLLSNLQSQQDETFYLGIEMAMDKGWHTYWQNPGDSGGAFDVIWENPEGFIIENVSWPTPELIPYPPLMTYGYEDYVLFPFQVFRTADSDLGVIKATINFLICADICVPESASIEIDLSTEQPSSLIGDAIKSVPKTVMPVSLDANNQNLNLGFAFDGTINDAYFFTDNQGDIKHSASQKLRRLGGNNYELILEQASLTPDQLSGILKINDSGFIVMPTAVDVSTTNSFSINLFQALLFAFIGGLILNLMPCVFPVIALKALSFIKISEHAPHQAKWHGWSYTVGVLSSFVAIALVLIGLKAAGESLGWGFQLQAPEIVGGLALLMVLIGFILLSDINIGTSLTSVGSKMQQGQSYSNSFATGVLAVVVASPCTAPFMGAALGFALVQPTAMSLMIFIMLGLGFALPYLMLSIVPSLVAWLPKPGAWMETFKQIMAFPMFATAIWLIWVFAQQTSPTDLVILMGLILVMGFGLWFGRSQNRTQNIGISVIVLLAVIFGLANLDKTVTQKLAEDDSLTWQAGIEEQLQAQQQAYFINFTAAWCITCQANEQIALSRDSVKEFFNTNNIKYIKADWTNRNDDIANTLSSYNRSGVPLYVFWKPGMQTPKILPAILTEGYILGL